MPSNPKFGDCCYKCAVSASVGNIGCISIECSCHRPKVACGVCYRTDLNLRTTSGGGLMLCEDCINGKHPQPKAEESYTTKNGRSNDLNNPPVLSTPLQPVAWEKEFVDELRIAIGYSGGAADEDIVSCRTEYGHEASMRFDVLSKSLVEIARKLLTQATEAGYQKGLRENMIKVDEFFAEGIAKGTDEASKLVRETIQEQARQAERARIIGLVEEMEKEFPILGAQTYEDNVQEWKNFGYNSALADVIKKLGYEKRE